MFGDPEPDMLSIVKGLFYFLELQDFLIKIRSPVEVCHKDGLMAEMGSLAAGGEPQQDGGGEEDQTAGQAERK